MAPRRAVAAVAAVLSGLALAGEAEPPGQRAAHAAEAAPALVPLTMLGHPALQVRPAMPPQPGPQTCAIRVDRCSTDPCIQFVRDRRRCDPYPDAVPRMIPVR